MLKGTLKRRRLWVLTVTLLCFFSSMALLSRIYGGFAAEEILIWARKKTSEPVVRLNSVAEVEAFATKYSMYVVGLFENFEEAFANPNRDESLILELLELKQEVADEGSAIWFLQELAREQDAEGGMVFANALSF